MTVRAALGQLSAFSVFLLKSILYGAFVLVCSALNGRKRRFPARAVWKPSLEGPGEEEGAELAMLEELGFLGDEGGGADGSRGR